MRTRVPQPTRAARLAVTAIAGQGIAYLLALPLARRLGVAGFEAYAVSGAVFALMAKFAPRGIEKYALRALLALFRPEFAEVGVLPLRVLAVSTAFTVLLSLAPTYLKFRQRNRSTYAAVGSAAAAQGVLLLWLVPAHGALGAALAYAISMSGMYGAFAWMAHRELVQFEC